MSDLKPFPTTHLHYSPTYCSQMLGQGHLADQSNLIDRNDLSHKNGGTTININYNEKLNRCLPKSVLNNVGQVI